MASRRLWNQESFRTTECLRFLTVMLVDCSRQALSTAMMNSCN